MLIFPYENQYPFLLFKAPTAFWVLNKAQDKKRQFALVSG